MARKLRIEYEHTLYHVLNRGNYRADIFEQDGAKEAFERCLWEACGKCGWVVHAYVLMRNHYHLALETPKANLVSGMKWLQATFANRFNRFRTEHGHVFQGRYQAIVLEDARALGTLCHYIHLNPIRAGIVTASGLKGFRYGSYYWLGQARNRPKALDLAAALEAAGGLDDTSTGRRKYQAYLEWLAIDVPAQRELEFEKMSRGWAFGTKEFKKALAQELKEAKRYGGAVEAESAELRELVWDEALQRCLRKLRHRESEAANERKSAPWKIAIAVHLRQISTASNPWLARRLHMGDPDGVSRYCAECRAGQRPEAAAQLLKITEIRV